jgi:hypothetical protein
MCKATWEIHGNLCQDTWSLGGVVNPGLRKYEETVLTAYDLDSYYYYYYYYYYYVKIITNKAIPITGRGGP